MSTTVKKTVHNALVKGLGERQYRFKISDAGPDHMGDDLPLEGWDFTSYSGRVLWAHDQSIPAIARSSRPWITRDGVYADAEFPPKGVYPFADQIEGLVAVGHLGEASVGFKPDPEGRQRNKHGGMTYGKKTLLEWSIVNTPANPRATLVQPSTRGADLETITKWLQDRALPASFRLSKGEVRLGPAPVPAGTAPGEVRIGGGTSAANLALAFPSITRLLRPPTMKSHHLDLPPGVSDGDVRRMVVDGVRRELDRVGRRLRAQGY